MQVNYLLFLSSVAIPVLSLVPGSRDSYPRTSETSLESTLKSRYPQVSGMAHNKTYPVQYDSYLPELPPEWPNIMKSLSLRPRGDMTTRDNEPAFVKYSTLGVKIFSAGAYVVTWYGLVASCQQFTQGTGNAVQCLFGAITTVISLVTLAYQGADLRGQLAQSLTNSGWHIPGINKRDEWASILARDLSVGLNTEVRHLGTWDPSKTTQKRGSEFDSLPREVFGLKYRGQDFHFTYMGRDTDGKNSWKFGLGDGGSAALQSTKSRRQTQVTYANYYFTSGGIDFNAQSVEDAPATEWTWGSTSDSVEFDDIYNSVSCYFGAFDPIPFAETILLETNALNFQVYDSLIKYTLSAGVMSPFYDDYESAIRDLNLTGGIGTTGCGTL
ncbi:hypothetical protein F5Y03DRAFT_388013 [Xylaria venustula]|nr:hypothetical protein F5Y03DRAFT_388013 [Xylaria venustula]